MATIDFISLQKKYSGLWVAMEEKNKSVVSSGNSAKKVYSEAKKLGIKIPTMYRVPKEPVLFVG